MIVAYLMNRMPSRVLGYKTPIECLTGDTTYVVPPKVFGCTCFVKDYRPSVGKLDPRALKCIFVGYSSKQKRLQVLVSFGKKNVCEYGCGI